ncbi:MAG TPA: hypothetical protein VHL09_13225 [Dehalococcoidia bacterium]|nr:hypothetical protein [Dehalococcoidia bacterium]
MEALAVAAVLVVVILAPLIVLAWGQRRAEQRSAARPEAAPPTPVGWGDVTAGDQVTWADQTHTIRAVIDCREERDHRVYGWRWLVLDTGGLLEYRGRRLTLFSPPEVLDVDSAEHEALTGQRGALAAYESGSRLSWDPVVFRWANEELEVTGTGTFHARTAGEVWPESVWSAVSRDPKENIYFALERTAAPGEDPADGDVSAMILGIWTDRVALYRCERLGPAAEAWIQRPGPEQSPRTP